MRRRKFTTLMHVGYTCCVKYIAKIIGMILILKTNNNKQKYFLQFFFIRTAKEAKISPNFQLH